MTTGKVLRSGLVAALAGMLGCAQAPADVVHEPKAPAASSAAAAQTVIIPSAVVPTEPAPSAAVPAKPVSTEGMALLPGGAFVPKNDSKKVTVAPFWLDVTEVTAGAYQACVAAGKCTEEGLLCEKLHTYGVPGKEKYPLDCVNYPQAMAYCASLGKRLPRAEEWEWAARGATRGSTYPWGEEAPSKQLCWHRLDYTLAKGKGPCAVHSFPAGDTPQGIADLAGNVAEWAASSDPKHAYVHGGDWTEVNPEAVEASGQSGVTADFHGSGIGFRCAWTAAPR